MSCSLSAGARALIGALRGRRCSDWNSAAARSAAMIAQWSDTGKTSSRRRGIRGGAASKRAAESRDRALLPTVRKLKARGFASHRALADELNQKGIPAPQGGRWHPTTVARLLTRLGLVTPGNGRINNRLAHKRAADARATGLAATIRKLRKAGFVSLGDIACELDKRKVPTARAGKWHRASARNCCCAWRSLRPLAAVEVDQAADIAARAVFSAPWNSI